MKPENLKILLLAALSIFFAHSATAQPKNAGMDFSLDGLSASYEHFIDSESFLQFSLKAECADMFFGMAPFPGASLSLTWNMIISEKKSCNGNDIRFFAGPGMTLGWGSDLLRPPGLIAGLKARVGTECEFDRNVTLSISLCPVIGTHVHIFEDYVEMNYYRIGLLSSILPVIGIKHTF